jgi:hypothetical protein
MREKANQTIESGNKQEAKIREEARRVWDKHTEEDRKI